YHLALSLLPPRTLCPYTTLFRSRRTGLNTPNLLLTNCFNKESLGQREFCAAHKIPIDTGAVRPYLLHCCTAAFTPIPSVRARHRSEEHTSELQSRENLVCRLLLE